MQTVQIVILLLSAVAALALLAPRLKTPYPILLVLGGLIICFIPGLPEPRLNPDIALLIFLPPLLFAQSWITPWRDLQRYRRPIAMLAVGLVLFTTVAVGYVTHWLMGLPLAAGFALGAIISPPDAVAASAIAERLGLPRRIVTILEGESLVNDATGLVAYKFAIAAMLTGSFSLVEATGQFFVVVTGGVALGLGVAWVAGRVLARIHENPVVITLTLLVPYAVYVAAEHLHVSGVLGVVAAGQYLGWRAPVIMSASTRLQAGAFWDILVFLLNSIIFLLIGLQLPFIWSNLSGYSSFQLITYGAAILGVVILVRPLWVFPGAYLPRLLSRRVRETEPPPGWRNVLVLGWSGMRGVVSLAAALAVPLTTADGSPFPGRDLILFLTFAVILGTLVGQGLTLAPLIRWLGVHGDSLDEKQSIQARVALAEAAQLRLAELAQEQSLPEIAITSVRATYDERLAHLTDEQAHVLGWSQRREELVASRRLRRECLRAELHKLIELRERGDLPAHLYYELQHELDLEEEKLR